MNPYIRLFASTALALPLLFVSPQIAAQDAPTIVSAPASIQAAGETPWIYEGSDVPQDAEWVWGRMDNGLRYAVRENGVPPGQVSIRIRIDAGSLHERESELGFAHLLEHLSFRESAYLEQGAAIPTWQRLGATFGSDTNAETSPTHTVYKLDLPTASPANLEESFKLLSGMMRAPVLSAENLAAEVPIVLAEKRERGGPATRVMETTRATLFAGQRLADRLPIGTEATLTGATPAAMQAFHARWYRPENTVISVAGDYDPLVFAQLIERYFGDWTVDGAVTPAPDFGDPLAPAGSAAAAGDGTPVGEVAVMVEPDLPRSLNYAIMRPWRQVKDTIVYNEGRLADALAIAIIQRRLEAQARAGASFLYAGLQQERISRSADATIVSFAPIGTDWKAALTDVRAIIADALTTPPTQEEIDREAAQYDSIFVSLVEQRSVMPGSRLADEVVNAVDIRESVAAPETFLQVFRGMKDKITPDEIFDRTKALFSGNVVRATYITPHGGRCRCGAGPGGAFPPRSPRTAIIASPRARSPSTNCRPWSEPGTIVSRGNYGLNGVERIEFANGTTALMSANTFEPGRIAVRVRFGAGYRAFDEGDAPYIALGQAALIGAGQGELGQEQLDRISNGRVMDFDFAIAEGTFTFGATTRAADLDDQLYLFANKLADPRWDENPGDPRQGRAAPELRILRDRSGQCAVARPANIYMTGEGRVGLKRPIRAGGTRPPLRPEGFRKPSGNRSWRRAMSRSSSSAISTWKQGIESLRRTLGALPGPRAGTGRGACAKPLGFATPDAKPIIRTHRGDANQAAAVSRMGRRGADPKGLPESRQLEILTSICSPTA